MAKINNLAVQNNQAQREFLLFLETYVTSGMF